MGREVRMVPAGWKHPKDESENYEPLFDGSDYEDAIDSWNDLYFDDWDCEYPDSRDYMPVWKKEEKTHYVMYETTTEGTPMSPSFKTPEKLAKWLYENEASAFGSMTHSYKEWLDMINYYIKTRRKDEDNCKNGDSKC